MGEALTPTDAAGEQHVQRRGRQMWAWIGGVFGICLVFLLIRSVAPLAEAEASFQRLLPSHRVIAYPLNPGDVPQVLEAQAEFARHGSNAVAVTASRMETVMSRRAGLTLGLSYRLLPESLHRAAYDNWTTAVARCALAVEALGDARAPLVETLAREFLRRSAPWTRRVAAAQMLGFADPEGEAILASGLTNANPTIREASVDGLRIWTHRKASSPQRQIPIVVSVATWTAVTAGQGIYKEDTQHWAKWGADSAWMFATNGVWLLSAPLQDLRSPSLARRLTATSTVVAALKDKRPGIATVRSNFVNVCLEILNDPEPSERGRAATVLADADAREPRVLAALERALTDPNAIVREDATNALRKLGRSH